MEAACCAGDPEKAYEALHLASCALLPDAAAAAAGGEELLSSGQARLAAGALRPWRALARVVLRGASLLERERRYEDAVHYLRILLQCPALAGGGTRGIRGEALVRLVTDLEHLNRQNDALEAAEAEVARAAAAPGRCCAADVALSRAVARLAAPPRRWKRPVVPQLLEPPEVTVSIPRDAKAAGRAAWAVGAGWNSDPGVGMRRSWSEGGAPGGSGGAADPSAAASAGATVERAVLEHYAKDGWRGAHSENGPFLTLFTLLLWDALYGGGGGEEPCPLPALTPLADAPLDLCRASAAVGDAAAGAEERRWLARARARLAELAAAPPGEVSAEVLRRLSACGGTPGGAPGVQARGVCPPESAALNAADLAEVAGALGGRVLSGIFDAFLTDYDGAACGFPDLLLWRPGPGVARLVEVKGPGDKLSGRQIATLHRLLAAGADVWVCYVVDGNSNGGGGGGAGGGASAATPVGAGGLRGRSVSNGGSIGGAAGSSAAVAVAQQQPTPPAAARPPAAAETTAGAEQRREEQEEVVVIDDDD